MRIAAKTSVNRIICNNLGFKVLIRLGWYTNPKKIIVNKEYWLIY